MIDRLYRCVLLLHPREFRTRFNEEMLWIFDEAADTWGPAALLRDAILSLLRQWLVRSGLWKWVLAGVVGLVPLIIAFGPFILPDKPVLP